MMTLMDTHELAKEYADSHTRYYFGDDAVPCEPGSEAHAYWLKQYDGVVKHWEGSEA